MIMARLASSTFMRRITSLCLPLALVVGLGLTTTACPRAEAATLVGESVGYAAERGFFKEALAYGEKALARGTLTKGGEYAGSEAGLYGGTLKTSSCDIRRLISFLKDPANHKKAAAWAKVLGQDPGGIENFLLHEVTSVLLGNDTLVRNHGYDQGNAQATPYDSVLEAGTAVLVDIHGVPAVKCNCGNPLTLAKTAVDANIDINFKGKKWAFEKKRMTKVKKSGKPRKTLVLANVEAPGGAIERPVGANGAAKDQSTRFPGALTVPDLVGQREDEARARLKELGLKAVSKPAPGSGQEQGTVTATRPSANSTVRPGSTVTLEVVGSASTTPTGAAGSSNPGTPPSDTFSPPTSGPPLCSTPPGTTCAHETSPGARTPAPHRTSPKTPVPDPGSGAATGPAGLESS
ncbi:DUF6777 domain-containing protein [Streptomyces cinnamoneus]|uniref:DUF6777 domain-containing protein n=1 Tax=Streptomyces cinnamoneus TaxID=53446 RepID=UPI0033D9E311